MNAANRYDQDPAAAVADALRWLPPDCDRETWVLLGMAVKDALGELGFDVWDSWSQGAACYKPKDALSAWKSFKEGGKVTARTLFHLAKQAGWNTTGGAVPPIPRPSLNPEREAARIAEEKAAHEAAASKAWNIFRRAPLALEHPYLTRKRIQDHGARLAFGKLAIPLFADPQRLANLQFIDAEGTKRFLKGGQKAGCYWWIGNPTAMVCIAEGFATAASILEATGNRCYIAFDAGNLPAVAEAVRRLLPEKEIVVCADNDESGKGEYYAKLAAWKIGAAVALPDRPGQDFNDMAGG